MARKSLGVAVGVWLAGWCLPARAAAGLADSLRPSRGIRAFFPRAAPKEPASLKPLVNGSLPPLIPLPLAAVPSAEIAAPVAAPARESAQASAASPATAEQARAPLDRLFDSIAMAPEGNIAGFSPPDPGTAQVALLRNAREMMGARVNLFSGAGNSVYAGYYRITPDAAGLTKLFLLRDARRRGKEVRLILDYWGNFIHWDNFMRRQNLKPLLKHLIEEGVEIRLYHPPRLSKLWWLFRRMHDKWLVSGRRLIVGDANMAEKYVGLADNPWISREVFIEGGAAAQAQAYAEALWESGEAAAPGGLHRVKSAEVDRARAQLDEIERGFKLRGWSPGSSRAELPTMRVPDEKARFVSDPIKYRRRVAGTSRVILGLIRRAVSSIVIENAYIVLPEIMRRELLRARAPDRRVKVEMLTNSYETNNLRSTRIAYEAGLRLLRKVADELREFRGPGTLHAKDMVVDEIISYVGSFNYDTRSLLLDLEAGALIEDAAFARVLLEEIRKDRANSSLAARNGVLLRRVKGFGLWRMIVDLWQALRDQI